MSRAGSRPTMVRLGGAKEGPSPHGLDDLVRPRPPAYPQRDPIAASRSRLRLWRGGRLLLGAVGGLGGSDVDARAHRLLQPFRGPRVFKEVQPMFRDARISSGFAVDDLERAKVFYGQTVGLDVVEVSLGVKGSEVPRGLELHSADGTTIGIYAKKDHTPATFTVLSIRVDDIEAAIDELASRGVRFESYGGATPTNAKGTQG